VLLPLLLALQGPLAVRADTLRPRHDALHHDVTIVLGDTGAHIVGIMQTTWRLRSDEPVEVQLDSAFRVVRVLTDGEGERRMARITFARNPGGGVYIPHHKKAGDTLQTSIRYHGTTTDGLIIRTDSSGRRTVFADNWPDRAHRWLPLEDHPSDKATVDFHVEAPAGMTVVANGTRARVDTLPRGRRVWHFRMPQRIPSYGMVIGAGPLVTTGLGDGGCAVRCVPVDAVTFPEDSARAVSGPFRRAAGMVDYLSDLLGPFPYDRLSHVQSTTIFGGAENPTAVFYNTKAISGGTLSEVTVAHETAHQWFGDAVTEDDWHHLWLSEGFATYLAAMWVRHADGDSAFRALMRRNAEAIFKSPATGRPILDPDARDLMGLLNSNNYQKGGWVLHTLRGLIGDSAFRAGLRGFYTTYRDSTALSVDLAREMSAAAGRDLEWYFRQALTQPGYPKLEAVWRQRGGRLSLAIRQVQPEEWGLYRLPGLKIRIDGETRSVDVEGKETVVRLEGIRTRPRELQLDPDGWWLMEATVREAGKGETWR
jgi:aminopeptidase N